MRKFLFSILVALLLSAPASAVNYFCCYIPGPILNSVSVPAVAAYSTRKLNSAFSGSPIRVQRNFDGNQQDIGFTAAGQLDTTALTAFCTSASSACFIIKWYDQSGNAIDANAGDAPLIAASAVPYTMNGFAATRFGVSGPSNNMQATLSISQPTTIVFAAKFNSLVANGHYTDGSTGSPRELIGVLGGPPPNTYALYAGSAASTGGTPNLLAHNYVGIFNGASSSLLVDGTAVVSGNPGTDGIGTLSIGASNGGGGAVSTDSWMGDFIVFNSVLSAGDQALIRASMQKQWGTP